MTSHGTKVLIVCIDVSIREMLAESLQAKGYTVETAENGLIPNEKWMTDPDVDVVVCDLVMPGISAIELIREFRSKNLQTPVVILTTVDEVRTALEAIECGADSYVLKDGHIRDTIEIAVARSAERHRLQRLSIQLQEELSLKSVRLEQEMALAQDVSMIRDVDLLLENILISVRRILNADAGSIYIRDGERLKFQYTQNDTLQSKLPTGKKLIYSTFSLPINDKSIAGYVANSGRMVNIGDVYKLTNNAPYSFSKKFDQISGYLTKSVLAVPLRNNRDDVIGVLQLINARGKEGEVISFSHGDESVIMNFANNAAIAIERAQMTRTMILRMIKMAQLHDPKETGEHVNRVASYAVELYDIWARGKGIPKQQIEKDKDVLRMAAMLHDVGKIAIPDTILKKPGRLDPDEYAVMKQHTYLGARLFSDFHSELDEVSLTVVLNHHERWDGQGYPGHIDSKSGEPIPGYENTRGAARGKEGEEIPPFGRIVAIADVFDALCSKRVYKDRWDESKALEVLKHEAGKQFDPEMIEAFLSILDTIRSISDRYPDE